MSTRSSTLLFDGMVVPVTISSTSRKAKLTVERDGSLTVTAAPDVEEAEIGRFLASKREWIYSRLAEKENFAAEPVSKELVNGEGFQYLGRSYQLRLADEGNQVRMHAGKFILPRPMLGTGAEHIVQWYRDAGLRWLRPRSKDWSSRLRVHPRSIEVADLGNKWGSAGAAGRIRIHWVTMQLRPVLVDYVLAHELAHLREGNHGAEFWQVLGRAMPDFDERKCELAEAGASIWRGAIGT
ncbi:MAG: M48 family metallopeptidase [Mycolicibacterium cosmeticum]|nr:M48 family metallopeptidase [Mycolicibacterium cosmeticum]